MDEFDVNSLQSVFFVESLKTGDKLDFARSVVNATRGIFDGDPMILPLPEEQEQAPPDVPYIVLKSKNNWYRCNICGNRIDLFFKRGKDIGQNISELWPDYKNIIKDFSNYIKETLNEKIWRLGFVATFVKDVGRSVNEILNGAYLQPNIFEDSHEIQLNILKKINFKSFNINRWIKFRPLRIKEDLSQDFGMSIEIDINTIAEKVYDFDKEEIMEFFNFAHENIVIEVPKYILIKS